MWGGGRVVAVEWERWWYLSGGEGILCNRCAVYLLSLTIITISTAVGGMFIPLNPPSNNAEKNIPDPLLGGEKAGEKNDQPRLCFFLQGERGSPRGIPPYLVMEEFQ